MKKKIAIFTVSMSGGGAERVIATILDSLEKDYDFHLCLLSNHIAYDLPANQKINVLKIPAIFNNSVGSILVLPLLAFKYYRYCKKNDIEISFSFLSRPNWINCLLKYGNRKVKILISERTTTSVYYSSLNSQIIKKVSFFLIKWLYPKADLIVPNSQGVANDLMLNLGVENHYQVLNNPIAKKKVIALSQIPINQVSKSSFKFICVARFFEEKNHQMLLQAFKRIADKDIELWLLGDGKFKTDCENICEKLNISNKVHFLGFDNNPYKYMSKADCFVMTSNFEGFPNVLVEALTCNLPVISTDCQSGPREILAPTTDITYQLTNTIEYAEYGILTPVNNIDLLTQAMEEIYNNQILRSKYQKNSIRRTASFDTNIIIKQVDKLFKTT